MKSIVCLAIQTSAVAMLAGLCLNLGSKCNFGLNPGCFLKKWQSLLNLNGLRSPTAGIHAMLEGPCYTTKSPNPQELLLRFMKGSNDGEERGMPSSMGRIPAMVVR